MKRFFLAAAVAALGLVCAVSSHAQNRKLAAPITDAAKVSDLTASSALLRAKATSRVFTPNLLVGQFNATRFADRTAVSLLVLNDGPSRYTGGRSYVIEEFLPGGGSRVLQTGPIPALTVNGFKTFLVYVPYDNRAHTYSVRLIPGDREPGDDVKSCAIQPNAPDHTKHPRER